MYDCAAGSDRNHLDGVHIKDPNRNKNTVQNTPSPEKAWNFKLRFVFFTVVTNTSLQ